MVSFPVPISSKGEEIYFSKFINNNLRRTKYKHIVQMNYVVTKKQGNYVQSKNEFIVY